MIAMRPPLCALALVLAVGCGHVTSVDNPGDHWLRVDSPNFRVFTDTPEIHYKFVAARLEHIQLAIKQAFFPGLETPPLDVLFLADETLFVDLSNNVDLVAMFIGGGDGIGKDGILVMRSGEGDNDELMAGWGVASHIVSYGAPHAPPWLHLGFASFLETAMVRNDGVAYFGRPPETQAIEILQGRLLPLGELETATWADMGGPETRRHYATAWAFVHYMAVGGTPEVQKDLFQMLALAGAALPANRRIRIPITKYEDGFKDYALKTFAGKPSVKVFVEKLGQLADPQLNVSPVPAAEIKALLQAIRAKRQSD